MKKYFYAFCFVLAISNIFSQATWASFVMSNTACVGSTLSVVANTGTNVAIGYTWTALPSNSIIASPNNSITALTFTPAGTYTIMLTADDGSTIATDSKTISSGPSITITGPTSSICPLPSAVGGVYMTASGASTYTWNPGNIVGPTYFQSQPASNTVFTVTGTNTNGCIGSATWLVMIKPQLPIYVTGPSVVCDGSYNCFTAVEGPGFFGPAAWTWQFACTSSLNNPACITFSPGCNGTYTVYGGDYTASQNCIYTATFNITVSPCTGFEKLELKNISYDVFPNPIVNTLYIKSSFTKQENADIEVTDISGRVISKSKCNFNSENTYTIDVSEFSPGIYFTKIISENQISRPIKIVKE